MLAGRAERAALGLLAALALVAAMPAEARAAASGGGGAAGGAAEMPSAEELEALWRKLEAAPRPLVPYRGPGAAAEEGAGDGAGTGERAACASKGGGAGGGAPDAGGGGAAPGAAPGGGAASGAAPGGGAASGGAGDSVNTVHETNVVHGSVTLGYAGSFDRTDGAPERSWHAPRASSSLTVDRIGGAPLHFRFRGDARAIIEDPDRRDRTGARLDERVYLTEASLTYVGEANPLRLSLGRTFAAGAAQAGTVDGARAGLALGWLEVGGFGGLDPAPDLSDRGRWKYGAYATLETPGFDPVGYRGALALVSTTEDGDLDRRLCALDQRLLLGTWGTVFTLVEVDLTDGTANPLDRPAVDLTALTAGLRARPLPWLDLGVSCDRRRAFFGAREADDLFPATLDLLETGPYTTLRADGRAALPAVTYVRAWGDRRLGAGDGLSLGGEVGCDALAGTGARAALGGSWTRTERLRGVALTARAGASVADGLDATLGYSLWADRYDDGEGDDVLRHEVRLTLEWFATRSLTVLLDGGVESGDEVRRGVVFAAVTYRF